VIFLKICVVGVGYVGLVAALSFAKYNNDIICVDKDINKIKQLNNGIIPIFEEGLEELLNTCIKNKKISFTQDLDVAIKKSEIIFIAVGTPTNDDWSVDISQVIHVANEISKAINKYKVVVIKSTVPVGTNDKIKKIFLNNGLNDKHFDIVSNPEFLREGKALNDFLNGDRMVLGCESKRALKILEKLYRPFNTKLIFTTPQTAELIKYASNAFLATKISFINEIANLCSKVNANIETISYALGLDNRISAEFLKAGIGYGGSCFPKDTKALVSIGKEYNSSFNIIESTIEVNENQRLLPVKLVCEHYNDLNGKIISIFGLTFKPGTDDIREAPSLYIINELLKKGAKIKCYDPMVSNEIKNIYPDIIYCNNIYETVDNSSCIIICTELMEFYNMNLKELAKIMNYPMLIDGRNIIDMEKAKKSGFQCYYSIGNGSYDNN
jgi:UDPglucose 6-dehydrogenase